MKIKLFCCTLGMALSTLCLAQQAPVKLTPFTGTNYLRLTVNSDFRKTGASVFKVSIRDKNNKPLWQGNVAPSTAANLGSPSLSFTVNNLKPILWQPSNPYLYTVSLQQFGKDGKLISELTERAGFRSFERRGGNLFLNGKPIFLRGIAINPPGRGIPDKLERSREFALEYVAYMKSINVNIIRIPDEETWFDVCDELGMMVFGGNYGAKVAANTEKVVKSAQVGDEEDGGFPKDYDKGVAWYENEKLGAIAQHPSLMIYAMTNETPFAGSRAAEWEKFLDYAFQKLKKWDETRVYIANAGYGYGKTGDITDIHRYWGWYYSSPFTFLHIRNEAEINPFGSKHQPLTFTECVGNYTGPDGRYNLTPAHKNPSSQLAWTGHERQDLQAQLADKHQAFTFRQATETFRQLRSVNPDLSGVFPFTILFYNWDTIEKFDDMNPKPVTDQVKLSYQPVLVTWESWTPNVFAGSVVRPIVHIVNDTNDFSDLKNAKLVYEIKDKTRTVVYRDSVSLPQIAYYSTYKKQLEIRLPENLNTGQFELWGNIIQEGKLVSKNYFRYFIADKQFTRSADKPTLMLYDGNGKTKASLGQLAVPFQEVTKLDALTPGTLLVIGENAADAQLSANSAAINKFIAAGGRLVSLRQDSVHMVNLNTLLAHPLNNRNIDIDNPVYPVSSLPPRNGYYVNPERPEHPVFAGITRDNLRVWSDYTNWDETKPGYPAIQPVTDGFMFTDKNDVGSSAILANYSSGLQAIALAEQFKGVGSMLLCGLDLANRTQTDPVAARMLLNILGYMAGNAGHEPLQLITAPIVWGEYETEKGVVTDLYSGFLVNSTPRIPVTLDKDIVVSKEGYQLVGGAKGGFNTRPGIQYVANGRRPFGPYAQSFGGQPTPQKGTTTGTGTFWCRIPEGKNTVSSLVWNPGTENIEIGIKVNDLPEVKQELKPGERVNIDAPVNSSAVNITYSGDRRLVVLETSFYKK